MISFFACACLSTVFFLKHPLVNENLVKLKWRGFASCGEECLCVPLLSLFFFSHTCVCLGKYFHRAVLVQFWNVRQEEQRFVFKVARNEVENASFAQRSAHRDSRIWRPELIEPAADRKRRARGRRPTFKSAYPNPQILPQCNINFQFSSNYPL